MKTRPLVIYGLLLIVLAAAPPAPPPPGDGWLGQSVQPAPDSRSALPWLRPGGHF
jgi:hypothetical protein